MNVHDRQPEVEILAEASLVDLGPEVAIGGGDDAYIDGAHALRPMRRTSRRSSARSSAG